MSRLYLEDIDVNGMLGYSVIKGITSYYILQQEVIDDEFTGHYVRRSISKEIYEEIQKVKNAKN